MCLDLKRGAKLQIATEDITVYKLVIKYPDITNLKSGMPFKSVIKGIECEGKICIEDNRVFLCTNNENLDGVDCDDKQGYKYSWVFDSRVDRSKTIMDGKPIPMGYITPYIRMKIKIGETYHSELKRHGYTVEEGLHSFKSAEVAAYYSDDDGVVVECIIPAGSKYYIGTFDGYVSYASSCIKYVRIVK